MSIYQELISKATKVSNIEYLNEIEDYMRHTIFNSTLDWQTEQQLKKAAKEAWTDIQFMRTPEGIKYLADLEAQISGDYDPNCILLNGEFYELGIDVAITEGTNMKGNPCIVKGTIHKDSDGNFYFLNSGIKISISSFSGFYLNSPSNTSTLKSLLSKCVL